MASYKNSERPPAIMQGSPPGLIPPRMDWDRPPWNRWSFQHIRELMPTVEVWRGSGPIRPLPQAGRDIIHLPVAGVKGEDTHLAALLDDTYTDGFLVIKAGNIVHESYYNGMEPRSLHLSQSVAKSVVGATAGILVERGLLDVTAPVTAYLPEMVKTGWQDATLQQVLNMTSGVVFSEDYMDPYSHMGQVDVAAGWKPVPPGTDPHFPWPQHVWEVITSLTATSRKHGAAFEYRSIETDVLAFCMERVTGERLAQLVSEEIWQKLGVEESGCFTVDPGGYALADGGFNATLRDYGRFGLMMLNNGQGIVPATWVEATRSGDRSVFSAPYTVTLPQGAYRNQFWIEDPVSRSLLCRGVFGQLIYISWEFDMVVVKLSTWPDFVNPHFTRATLKALRKIGETLAAK